MPVILVLLLVGSGVPGLRLPGLFVLLTVPMVRLSDAVARRWSTAGTGGAVWTP